MVSRGGFREHEQIRRDRRRRPSGRGEREWVPLDRGKEKSYCVLLTANDIGNDARERMKTMTSTNDGFVIAEKDLELRGPGDIEGTRQSGELNFKLASIVKDRPILETAKNVAIKILDEDPDLVSIENLPLKNFLSSQKGKTIWSQIS